MVTVVDETQDIDSYLESVKDLNSEFEEKSGREKRRAISEQKLQTFCDEMQLMQLDDEKMSHFLLQKMMPHIFNDTDEDDRPITWIELQKIKLKYGDPITGESIQLTELGKRRHDWKRTEENEYYCNIDNPFGDHTSNEIKQEVKPTIYDVPKEINLEINSIGILEKDIEENVIETEKDMLENLENRDEKKNSRFTMKRILFFGFFTLLDLLDPFIAVLLMR